VQDADVRPLFERLAGDAARRADAAEAALPRRFFASATRSATVRHGESARMTITRPTIAVRAPASIVPRCPRRPSGGVATIH